MQMKAKRPPPRELFFEPLYITLDPIHMERVQFAYICSKYGHAKQARDDGSRYFDHPKAAAWIYIHELGGRDPRMICDLLLHDLREDQYLLTPYRTNLNFGPDITLDVSAVTKLPRGKETSEDYLQRICDRGPWAILTKLCDRLHNIRTLDGCPDVSKRKRQITETSNKLMPRLLAALRTHGEPWVGFADRLESLLTEAMEPHLTLTAAA